MVLLFPDLEKLKAEAFIPGLAVAIVSGDELVYAKGFGLVRV